MTAPVIGVCTAFENASWGFWSQQAAIIPATYLAKIHAAGGIPLGLVPDTRAIENPGTIVDRIDGLLLIGGVDVEPSSYGATDTGRTEATEPLRDEFELVLAREAMRRDMPVLGVCRGMQILNVAAGGTLHQHLLDAGYAEHRPSPGTARSPDLPRSRGGLRQPRGHVVRQRHSDRELTPSPGRGPARARRRGHRTIATRPATRSNRMAGPSVRAWRAMASRGRRIATRSHRFHQHRSTCPRRKPLTWPSST